MSLWMPKCLIFLAFSLIIFILLVATQRSLIDCDTKYLNSHSFYNVKQQHVLQENDNLVRYRDTSGIHTSLEVLDFLW